MAKRITRSCVQAVSLLIALGPIEALASCMVPGPPCEVFWRTPVVFAGKVISITHLSDTSYGAKRVRFLITEAFRGLEAGEVDIHLRGGSNDPTFAEGEDWMIYAHHRMDGPGWTTSQCGRTARLADAREDVEYARLSDEAKGSSRVEGRVVRHDVDLSGPDRRYVQTPLAELAVTVKSARMAQQTRTAADGSYVIYLPAQQAFALSVESVPGLVMRGAAEVWIPWHRACASVNVHGFPDGRVSGIIRDARGAPVPYFPVALKRSGAGATGYVPPVLTGPDGRFEFAEAGPDRYVVTSGQVALAMEPVTLGVSGRVDIGALTLPSAARLSLIEGIVTDSEGVALPNAEVGVREAVQRNAWFATTRTDDQGRFAISVVAGKTYELRASRPFYNENGYAQETAAQTITAVGMKPIVLRLARHR